MHNLYLSLLITVVLYAPTAFGQVVSETYLEPYLDAEEIVPATEISIPQEAETQTDLWLQLQKSGAMAGSQYTQTGQTATLIYQRYLNSFSHPIPEQFKSDGIGDSGSSGSSGR